MITSQRGFTLLEMLVALAVGGMLMGVLSPTIYQLTRQTSYDSTRITALVQIETGARWLGRDIPQAQKTDLVPGAAAVSSMLITWTDWSDTENYDSYTYLEMAPTGNQVSYTLVGSELRRTHSTCSGSDPSSGIAYWNPDTGVCGTTWSEVDSRTVSRYIATAEFSLSSDGNMVTAILTAQPNASAWPGVKRSYRMDVGLAATSERSPVQ